MEIEVEVVYPQRMPVSGDAFTLVLHEKGGDRFVPVLIGLNEARSVVLELNHIQLPRPMSYDLFMTLLQHADSKVVKLLVDGFREGIYLAHLELQGPQGDFQIDARLSDAVVLALKSNVPICFEESVFNATSYSQKDKFLQSQEAVQPDRLTEDGEPDHFELGNGESIPLDLTMASERQLRQLLKTAEETENFELAAEIDDELKRRKEEDGE